MSNNHKYITEYDSIVNVINHPAFEGFGQYVFPWDDRNYNSNMQMNQISLLLPYHTRVDVDTAVKSLNHMVDDINTGEKVFYRFYTDDEQKKDPTKRDTGLFFYRGKPGAPFAVICAGGGFAYVGSLHEGFPYALEISEKGYNAFVLKYRVGSAQKATEDLAAAVSYIYKNANELSVRTGEYSLWGSSAGARMAAYIGTYGTASFGGDNIARSGTVVMAYTGHTDYSENDPPTFAVVGENDQIAASSVMERRIKALRTKGIDAELRKYPRLAHGFGLGIGTAAEGWIKDAIRFWEEHMR
jgi:acetyl esterase/lipase